ncbi:pectinesterase inhibitor 12-like [Zingiber officinale]|uniref:Pectinesterase inhibitor domain-containing protein n=1 Tax=Zingiber officinale TaxID=94328 RepID=A0A8J5HHR3_ZINOF|nr:pectinesterase inhibitor 12-like [Zingiber officinale]KAG6524757.1 hypothetical protein ZIOFF_014696 [Zingiber officinale]
MASFVVVLLALSSSGLFLNPVTGVCIPRNASITFDLADSPVALSPEPQSVQGPSKQQEAPAPAPAAQDDSVLLVGGGFGDGHLSLPPLLQAAVASLCQKTDYPDLCLSSAQQFLSASAGWQVDAVTFLKVQMAACRARVEAAKGEVAALLKQPGTTARVASTLQVCADSYDDAFDNLDAAGNAVAARDKDTINIMLSALVDDFATCEDGFAEMQDTSPLAAVDDALSKLGSNCLAIADLI